MFSELGIIVGYLLTLVITFSFSTLLRMHLDAQEKRKIYSKEKIKRMC